MLGCTCTAALLIGLAAVSVKIERIASELIVALYALKAEEEEEQLKEQKCAQRARWPRAVNYKSLYLCT